MRFLSLFSFIILLTGCIKNRNSENLIAQEQPDSLEIKIIPEQPNESELDQTIDSTYRLIEITEYLQYEKLIETFIFRDSIIRIKKDWQNGNPLDTLLKISTPNILSILANNIKKDFPRSASYSGGDDYPSYFVYLNIFDNQGNNIEVNFTNARTQGLLDLMKLINSTIPQDQQIITKGSLVVDNFVPESSMKTWEDYKKLTNYPANRYDISAISSNHLNRIDSTKLGKFINEDFHAKSLYLISIKENINSFYPCILLEESYHADRIEKYLFLIMVDSTFSELGDDIVLSSDGQEYATDWTSYSVVIDSLIKKTERTNFDCDEFLADYKTMSTVTSLKMMGNGGIKTNSIDTLNIEKCPEQTE